MVAREIENPITQLQILRLDDTRAYITLQRPLNTVGSTGACGASLASAPKNETFRSLRACCGRELPGCWWTWNHIFWMDSLLAVITCMKRGQPGADRESSGARDVCVCEGYLLLQKPLHVLRARRRCQAAHPPVERLCFCLRKPFARGPRRVHLQHAMQLLSAMDELALLH